MQVAADRAGGKHIGDSRNLVKAGPLADPARRPHGRRDCDARVWRGAGPGRISPRDPSENRSRAAGPCQRKRSRVRVAERKQVHRCDSGEHRRVDGAESLADGESLVFADLGRETSRRVKAGATLGAVASGSAYTLPSEWAIHFAQVTDRARVCRANPSSRAASPRGRHGAQRVDNGAGGTRPPAVVATRSLPGERRDGDLTQMDSPPERKRVFRTDGHDDARADSVARLAGGEWEDRSPCAAVSRIPSPAGLGATCSFKPGQCECSAGGSTATPPLRLHAGTARARVRSVVDPLRAPRVSGATATSPRVSVPRPDRSAQTPPVGLVRCRSLASPPWPALRAGVGRKSCADALIRATEMRSRGQLD